jgi:hypothetical protein
MVGVNGEVSGEFPRRVGDMGHVDRVTYVNIKCRANDTSDKSKKEGYLAI